MVEFMDLQDDSSPMNGAEFSTAAELSCAIDRLKSRPPFFFELANENGYKLLVGIGVDVGCAQYSPSDGSPPYLTATNGTELNIYDCVEFLITNTPTPVPPRYCLRIDVVKRIAGYFVETGDRSAEVCWEEIRPIAHEDPR